MNIILVQLRRNIFTFLFLIYLCFIAAYAMHKPFVLSAFAGNIAFLLLLYCISKMKYRLVLQIPLILLIVINAVFAFLYHAYVSTGGVAIMLESNMTEAISMLSPQILPLSLILFASSFLLLKSSQEMRKWTFSRKYALLFVGVFTFLVLPYITYNKSRRKKYISVVAASPVLGYSEMLSSYAPLFFGDIMAMLSYINEIRDLSNYRDNKRAIPEGITMDKEKPSVAKVYFVLGESSTRNHLSLYGYARPTTPFLDSLNANTAQLHFYKGIAPASYTREAVPIVMSYVNTRDRQQFKEKKHLVDLAKDKGYYVSWISNQPVMSVWGNSIGNLSNMADFSEILFSDIKVLDDFELLPIFDKQRKAVTSALQMYIFHLQGSHNYYLDRYDALDAEAVKGEASGELDYDRTIHHTDRFLRAVYAEMMKNESSILIYVPDHGECVSVGHGFCKLTRSMFEVPLVIINNSDLDIDAIVRKYIFNEDGLINTSSTASIVAEMMGYSVSDGHVQEIKDESKYVLHGVGGVFDFMQIEQP